MYHKTSLQHRVQQLIGTAKIRMDLETWGQMGLTGRA